MKTRRQRVIVECHGTKWWLMLDNGQIEIVGSASEALQAIQRAAKRGNKTVTVTSIEWRNVPDGFTPPTR